MTTPDTGHSTAEPPDAWVIGRFTDATAQHGDRTFEMWDDDVHPTSAAALHHHVMHVEDPDPWSWHIYALVRIAYAGPSGDTGQARALLDSDTAVEWGTRWADGGYCPATPPRSEDFAHKHARTFGTRAIYRKVGPWKYADTGEDAFPEQADRGIAAGEDQL